MPTHKQAARTNSQAARRRAEQQYYRLLRKINRNIMEALKGLHTPEEMVEAFREVVRGAEFHALCIAASEQMTAIAQAGEKATWREAAAASANGREVHRALMRELSETNRGEIIREMVKKNSELIKTVPFDIAEEFSELAKNRRFEGLRPNEIMYEMQAKAPNLLDYQARRIARTESAKASTALVQARAESLGLDFYRWSTSKDGDRVRESHQAMHNVICRWSDPPDPEAMAGEKSHGNYPPGGIFGCRCVALPVISARDIQFPCKAHKRGEIRFIGSYKALLNYYAISETEAK